MRKILIIIILSFGFWQSSFAQKKIIDKFEFGIEWGYSQNFYNDYSYTILSAAEGYKLKTSGSSFLFAPHLRFNINCSYLINDYLSASLVFGSMGIGESTNIYPLMTRFTYYSRTAQNDGHFSLIEAGYGVRKANGFAEDESFLLDIGQGYRLILSSRCRLEFIFQISYAYNKPQIPNPDGPGFVSSNYILSNFAENYALNFVLSLKF